MRVRYRSVKVKRFNHLIVICVTIITLFASSVSVAYAVPAETINPENLNPSPSPPIATEGPIDVQAEAAKLSKEIEALDEELAIAAESYNAVTVELERINQQLEVTHFDLGQAEVEFETRQEIYNNRLSALYKNGKETFLEVLLNTQDLADFIVRVGFLARIATTDTNLLEDLQLTKEDIEQARENLENLKQQQTALQQELEIKRAIIEIKINFRKELLANINEGVRRLLEQEQERKAAEARALIEYVRSQLGVMDVDHSPGSVVHTAFQYLGIPYKWGGDDPIEGFDCSGLVMYIFAQHGVKLPHYSRFQSAMGEPVVGSLQPGDLVFFGDPIHHVGMYIGGDYFIAAPRTGDVVKISILSSKPHFVGARRFPLKPKEEVQLPVENPDAQNQPTVEPVPAEEPAPSGRPPLVRLLSIPMR